ncbi:MAG: TlpA family protein disulfide reductase [Planctomycetaceae bacterium]|nr:TlpA family protein disulfide reductase [Planctomycetaceae bacterium]
MSVTCLAFLASVFAVVRVQSEDSSPKGKKTFQDVIVSRQKDLLRDADSYIEKNPEATDLDEAFAWSFETARRFGLEADALPLAERCLQSRTASVAAKTAAKTVLCVGLAKSGKLKDAVAAFQDSLQFARFGANEPLDLAIELVAQAGLAGDHTTAKKIYEILSNRFGLNPQIGEICGNRLRKLELIGTDAAELSLTDLGGEPASIAAMKGKVLLIDFWATNCPPCLEEFPKLKQLYADKHEEGFEVLGISLDDSPEIVEAFQARAKLPWKLVCEAEQVRQAREKYRVRTIPSLFLVGRDGRIAQVDLKGNDLRQAVERCLAEK